MTVPRPKSPGPIVPGSVRVPDDDDLESELPPLDGGSEEAESGAFDDDVDDEPTDAADDPFDDAAFGDDDDHELDPDDGTSGASADDADDLDVGESEGLDVDEESLAATDAAEPDQGLPLDFGLEEDRGSGLLDAGEEGPQVEHDDLSRQELPDLDADETGEGEGEGDASLATWFVPPEDVTHAWDDRAWERAVVPLRIGPVHWVAKTLAKDMSEDEGDASLAVAFGRALVIVSSDGRSALPEARGLGSIAVARGAVSGDRVVLVAAGGDVHVSDDLGETFVSLATRVATEGSSAPRSVADVAFASETLYVVASAGMLFASVDGGHTLRPEMAGRRFAAAGRALDGSLLLLEKGEGGTPAAVVRWSGRGAPTTRAIPTLGRGLRTDGRVRVVGSGGAASAFLIPEIGVFRALDGQDFTCLEGTKTATALAMLSNDGTLIVALGNADDEASHLVRFDAHGTARIVAELGPESKEDETVGPTFDLAWDPESAVLWAAGRYGLVAVRAPRPTSRAPRKGN
ncbi:MAG: hypothetical protein U0169_14505 [Polyangiaceae bacterium]